jgi:hypothetical protein
MGEDKKKVLLPFFECEKRGPRGSKNGLFTKRCPRI